MEIDHCYHAVPFIFSEIDKLTFSFIYAIFQYHFCQLIVFRSVGGDLKIYNKGEPVYKAPPLN